MDKDTMLYRAVTVILALFVPFWPIYLWAAAYVIKEKIKDPSRPIKEIWRYLTASTKDALDFTTTH